MQCQGQLQCTGREYCKLVIWCPNVMKIIHVERDDDLWRDFMLPRLTDFYFQWLLPEFLDSRHLRGMPMRGPSAVDDVPERSTNESGDGMSHCQSKRRRVDPPTVMPAADESQERGIVVISHDSNYQLTPRDLASFKRFYDAGDLEATLEALQEIVLPLESDLDDLTLAVFSRVVREMTTFITHNPLYINQPQLIERLTQGQTSLHILGGRCTHHWRCLHYDGSVLRIYDSMGRRTFDQLHDIEKRYVTLRYPLNVQIVATNVTIQPDTNSCGVYAAAFATAVALGQDPTEKRYSRDAAIMRQHLLRILRERRLSQFPEEQNM